MRVCYIACIVNNRMEKKSVELCAAPRRIDKIIALSKMKNFKDQSQAHPVTQQLRQPSSRMKTLPARYKDFYPLLSSTPISSKQHSTKQV